MAAEQDGGKEGDFLANLQKKRTKNQKQITKLAQDEGEDENEPAEEAEDVGGDRKDGPRQRLMEKARLRMSQRLEQATKPQQSEESPRRSLFSTTQELMGSRPGSTLSQRPGSSMSPRKEGTLSDTIRQRMADKIKNAKNKGKDTAYTEARTSSRRLAGIRGQSRLTRFDDPNTVITKQLDDTLERSLQTRKKWKDTTKSVTGEDGLSDQQQFDFFTRTVWTPEPSDGEQEDQNGSKGEQKDDKDKDVDTQQQQQEADDGEGTSRSKTDRRNADDEDQQPLLDDDQIMDELLYEIRRADYLPLRERLEIENETYFIPTAEPAPIRDKLFSEEEDIQPRYLEDEGLFVGKRPPETETNINVMENRLLMDKENAHLWFGEDGQIVALADPLKEAVSRPPIVEEVPPHLQTDYCKALPLLTNGRLTSSGLESLDADKFQLDVDINTLVFTHHHLFSREHVLAEQLTTLYRQYVVRSQKKAALNLTEKLKALKSAVEHIYQSQEGSDLKKNNPLRQSWDVRLQEYMEEIRQTRLQRDNELNADRTLLRNILNTWKEIKSLRTFQKFICTPVKLLIKKEAKDIGQDEAEWQEEIESELKELQGEFSKEHQTKMATYKEEMDLCKRKRAVYKEAQKRQRRRDRLADRGRDVDTTEEEQRQAEQDNEILLEGEPPKPEKPVITSEEEARKMLREKYAEIRRQPGEPLIIPELTNSAHITADHLCPRGEVQRKNDVNKIKIFVRVLFNDKEVSRTSAKPLSQHFTVSFAQIFSVQIMQWPENIKLQIVESTLLGSTLLSEVYAVIPEPNVTSDTVSLEEMEFSSDVRIAHNHEGVGSDVPFSFSSDGGNKQSLLTTGTLSTSVSWAVDDYGNVLIPPNTTKNQYHHAMHKLDAVSAIGVSGLSDIDKLTKWIVESRLDPNEPSNALIMAMIKPGEGGERKAPEHFRLEQLQEEFDFVSQEQMNSSPRLKLLQYRELDKLAEFSGYTMIPAIDSEVNLEILKEYERKQMEDQTTSATDDISTQGQAYAKYMKKIQRQVMMRFKKASKQMQLQDIVREDTIPDISKLIPGIKKSLEPRRPLRPVRKQRKAVTNQNIQETGVRLLVNIVRAFGVPVRSESTRTHTTASPQSTQQFGATGGHQTGVGTLPMEGNSYIDNVSICPFVEVMFQRETYSTSVAESANPSWNEELQIKFKPPGGDYRLANLQTVTDVLYINLFDEYTTEVLQDDRDRGTTVQRRVEKRWLGNIKIPFTTIYFSPSARIEGTFRVERPPVLLGYDTSTPSRPSYGGQTQGGSSNDNNDTYISLFVTLDPPLTPPDPPREKFESNEDEKLLRECNNWMMDLEKSFPDREYKTQVIDINGQAVFICRYLKAIKPPEVLINNLDNQADAVDNVARFVSLIPFVSDSAMFPGVCDIWSTCDQFLMMLQGDEEEHAVLLVNYLLYLGKKETYLLIGSAVPEGPTAYVLTHDGSDYWIWNASTGEKFNSRDNYCPVQSIGCLVSIDNIYANIQPYDHPGRMSLNVSNKNNWKPLFHKGFTNPGISSIQPDTLSYPGTDDVYVLELGDKIERQLKEKIMVWRPRSITHWNRYCIQEFRKLLVKLEKQKGKGQTQHTAELSQILQPYKMSGFPINQSYTGMEPLVEAVYATGVHNIDTPDVEFALAVHVHAYPCNILSVWVYVASLVKKR